MRPALFQSSGPVPCPGAKTTEPQIPSCLKKPRRPWFGHKHWVTRVIKIHPYSSSHLQSTEVNWLHLPHSSLGKTAFSQERRDSKLSANCEKGVTLGSAASSEGTAWSAEAAGTRQKLLQSEDCPLEKKNMRFALPTARVSLG